MSKIKKQTFENLAPYLTPKSFSANIEQNLQLLDFNKWCKRGEN